MTPEQALALALLDYVEIVARAFAGSVSTEVLTADEARTLGQRLRVVVNIVRPLLEAQAAAQVQALLPPPTDIL
jgi:hypothetical protein